MKKNEFNEIRKKPEAELMHELYKFSAKVRELRTGIATGKVKSLKELHAAKKSVAQIMTVLSGKKIQ